MKIYITFDYELYFGERTGSAERCIIVPTELLLGVFNETGIKSVQFIDCGYLLKLKEYRNKYHSVEKEYYLISSQLDKLVNKDHDLQLHIHPHWEDSLHDGNIWKIDPRRYKLSDFSDGHIHSIVKTYKSVLSQFTLPQNIFAFRAGGWCVQPFTVMKDALKINGIKVDSSVFKNGVYQSDLYSYDFRNSPEGSRWKFENDPLQVDNKGSFTEVPISSIYNSPLFYWMLFLKGRLNPHNHKPLGDGIPVPAPGQRKKLLSRFTWNTVSLDGYNAGLLDKALEQHMKNGADEMVIIGHPKALSRYGLEKLKEFIKKNLSKHEFTTFLIQKNTFS